MLSLETCIPKDLIESLKGHAEKNRCFSSFLFQEVLFAVKNWQNFYSSLWARSFFKKAFQPYSIKNWEILCCKSNADLCFGCKRKGQSWILRISKIECQEEKDCHDKLLSKLICRIRHLGVFLREHIYFCVICISFWKFSYISRMGFRIKRKCWIKT